MSPADVREGLRAALADAFPDAQCTGYLLGASARTPAFEVQPSGVEFDLAFDRGVDQATWIVRGFVATGVAQEAQVILDTWMLGSGEGSVKEALEVDTTLSGAVYAAIVTSVSEPKRFEADGGTAVYLGAEWTVEVTASG